MRSLFRSIQCHFRAHARYQVQAYLCMGIAVFAGCFVDLSAFAETNRPVRSLLEIRREHVVLQKWDLSCGAAALATLLRYQFREKVTEQEIARALMRRSEYIEHPELVRLQEGFSLLDLKNYVESYHNRNANSGFSKKSRRAHQRLQLSGSGERRIKLKHRGQVYKGEGLGQLDLAALVAHAPVMVPVNALGYNHFVVFRGVVGDRILLADPAWGNRTMTKNKFEQMWIDYGNSIGHVGFIIERVDGRKLTNKLGPKPEEIIMVH